MSAKVDRRLLLREMLKKRGIQSGLVSMPKVDRSKPLRLSLAQQRLWFLEQLVPNTGAYNIVSAMRLTGPLKTEVLERAFRQVIDRHEPLRTSFLSERDEPVQSIHREVPFAISRKSVSRDGAEEVRHRALSLLEEEGRRPFDLTRAPLLRATVVEVDDDDHFLGIAMHHIVSDGWSMGVFVDELSRCYTAIDAGGSGKLAPLEIEFADFADWQRRWLDGGELDRQLEFWRATLEGAPAVLPLPTDRPRPHVQSFKGSMHRFEINGALTQSLDRYARETSATLFAVLLAGFTALMHRYTGQDDIVIGSPFAGRGRVETEPLIGFFVNTLPLRTRFDEGTTFADLVKKSGATTVEVLQNQDVPFERLVEELRPERDLGHTPVFQVTFAFQNAPLPDLELSAVEVEYMPVDTGISKFDLSVEFEPGEGVLWGSINYATDLFDASTVARMSRHLVNLLAAGVKSPTSSVSELPMMGPQERALVTVGWNQTTTEYPRDATVHQLFGQVAAKHKNKTAVVWGDRKLTYGQLHRASSSLAAVLAKQIEPNEPVGILLKRSPEMVVAMLAILKAGGCYLPLDLDYPKQRVALMLEDARVRAVVTDAAHERLIEGMPVVAVGVEVSASRRPLKAKTLSGPEDPAYVMYTSGSTGKPKGIAIPHRAIVRLVRNTNYVEFATDSVVAQASNASFDAATFEIWGALLNGSTIAGLERESLLLGDELQRTISSYGINIMFLTTALFHQLASDRPGCFCELDGLYVGGEAADSEKFARVARAGKPRRLVNAYGPTESTTFASYLEFTGEQIRPGYLPIGRPISNTTCLILDSRLQPVPAGVPGELCLGGDGLAIGYLNRSDLTAERFVQTEFGRLYRTGDVARFMEDGVIEYLGRIDDQIKVRGFRIEPGEIEAALSDHPGVRDAVVAVKERGENRILVAYFIQEGIGTPVSELRAHLSQRLPKFMVPNYFLEIAAIPVTPNGKVDRSALPDPDGEGAQESEPLSGATEEAVARIFESLLGIDQVGADDNFFALGGHSLLATRVVSHIARELEVEVPLTCIFEDATVRGVAREVERSLSKGQTVRGGRIVRVERTSNVIEASFAQQRLWFFDQFEPGNSVYNVPMILRVRGRLGLDALREALAEETRRHEILRTTFEARAGKPVQVIATDMPVNLKIVDLSDVEPSRREEDAQAAAEEEATRPFDLANGPLLRTTVIKVAGDDQYVVFATHHIVSDGWSLGVLVGDLASLYEAFSKQLPSPLADLELQHADYSEWQKEWFEGSHLEDLLTYWKQKLDGAPEVLELPGDRPRPAVQTFDGASIGFKLETEIASRLKQFCSASGSTLFMVLLAAYKVLLFRYSRQSDIVVGTPIAGRTRAEMEGMIGFFVNTIVLRTDLSGNPTFAELVQRVKETSLGAFEHQDLPFEKLVEELKPPRDLAHSPVFQMVFSLQNVFAPPKKFGELAVELGDAEMGSAKFDLTLDFMETDSGIEGTLNYNVNIFEEKTAERMLRHFVNLLERALDDPESRIGRIPLMDDAEKKKVFELSHPKQSSTSGATITERFAKQVSSRPAQVALSSAAGTVTYRDLDVRSTDLARRLAGAGVRHGDLVPIIAGRTLETPIAMLAVLKAGAAYVPIDPAHPEERIQYVIDDTRADLVIDASDGAVVLPQAVSVIPVSSTTDGKAGELPVVTPDHPAYVIYTSGSTGRPKGVVVTHRNLVRLFDSTESLFGFGPQDVWSLFHSFAFDFSVWELWGALFYGGRSVIVPQDVARSPSDVLDFLETEKITVLNQTPSAFTNLSDVDGRTPEVKELALRWVIFGGEALEPFSLGAWFRRRGDKSPRLVNMYGITETTVHVTHRLLSQSDTKLETSPIGSSIGDLGVYVVDDEGNLCPVGVPGEVQVGGEGVALGYLDRPGLTADRFIPDDFGAAGSRRYRSGDLARLTENGDLEYWGRADDQIKIRGFRIEPGEVTAALSRIPGVDQAAVTLRRDDEGAERLVAYLRSAGEAPTVTKLRTSLAASLPDYMVPHSFVFVDEIPLTPNGKLDLKALPEPTESRPELAEEYAAPRTEVERKMAEIWQRTLKVERVGIYDNFFDLGGDSFSALEVVHLANEAGIPMSVRLLFQAQVIADLSIYTEPAVEVDAEQGLVSGAVPLSPQQAWYFSQGWTEPHHFNNQMLLEVRDRVEEGALRKTLQLLLQHHDQLRARFEGSDGYRQWIPESIDHDPLEVIDLSKQGEDSGDQAMWERAAEVHASLDLARGPLFKAILFNSEQNQHLLVIVHHLVVDAVSWGLILEDLDDVYSQVVSSGDAEFPPKTTSFKAWANRMSDYAGSKRASVQESLWRDLIPAEVASVPNDMPNGVNLYVTEQTHVLSVPPELTTRLLTDVPIRFNVGPAEVLLAGLAAGFQEWSGSSGMLVDLEGHGREDIFEGADLSGTVGWFAPTFPVYVEANPTAWEKTIRNIVDTVTSLPDGGVGYGVLRYMKESGTPLSDLPQPEIFFSFVGSVEAAETEVRFRPIPTTSGTPISKRNRREYCLEVGVVTSGRGLELHLTYSADLIEAASIESLAQHILKALGSIAG